MIYARPFFAFIAFSLVLNFAGGCNSTSIEKPFGKPLSTKQLSTIVGSWIDPNADELRVEFDRNGDFLIGKLEFEHDTRKFAVWSTSLAIRSMGKMNFAFIKNPNGEDYFFGRIVSLDENSVVIQPPSESVYRDALTNGVLSGRVVGKTNQTQRAVLSADEDVMAAFFKSRGIESCFSKDKEFTLRKRQTK